MKSIAVCALVMLAFISLGQVAMHADAPHLAIVLWSFALFAVGFLFYRLRIRSHLWYGGFEMLFALSGSYFVLLNLYQNVATLTAEIILSRMVLLFAAVYVMVSALTNIGESLLPTWRFTKIWKRLFRN
jgi:hypothetical protein